VNPGQVTEMKALELVLEADSSASLKGKASLDLKSEGITTVKGSLVKIN